MVLRVVLLIAEYLSWVLSSPDMQNCTFDNLVIASSGAPFKAIIIGGCKIYYVFQCDFRTGRGAKRARCISRARIACLLFGFDCCMHRTIT